MEESFLAARLCLVVLPLHMCIFFARTPHVRRTSQEQETLSETCLHRPDNWNGPRWPRLQWEIFSRFSFPGCQTLLFHQSLSYLHEHTASSGIRDTSLPPHLTHVDSYKHQCLTQLLLLIINNILWVLASIHSSIFLWMLNIFEGASQVLLYPSIHPSILCPLFSSLCLFKSSVVVKVDTSVTTWRINSFAAVWWSFWRVWHYYCVWSWKDKRLTALTFITAVCLYQGR